MDAGVDAALEVPFVIAYWAEAVAARKSARVGKCILRVWLVGVLVCCLKQECRLMDGWMDGVVVW